MTVLHYYSFRKFSPSVRYRGLRVLRSLSEDYKVQYTVHYPSLWTYLHILFQIVKHLLNAESDTILVFQKICRKNLYGFLCLSLMKLSKRTVYDIDDALYFFIDEVTILKFVKHANVVLVGSDFLKERYQTLNANIHKVTTPVYESTFEKHVRIPLLTIGWVGTYFSHRQNVKEVLLPALKHLDFECRLIMIGVTKTADKGDIYGFLKECPNIHVELSDCSDWENDVALVSQLVMFDVGTSPLIDNHINQARSAFKLKQYQEVGLPILASDVGENIAYIQHGFNGYLCRDSEDWVNYLTKLKNMSDEEYRQLCDRSLSTYRNSDYRLNAVTAAYYRIIAQLLK